MRLVVPTVLRNKSTAFPACSRLGQLHMARSSRGRRRKLLQPSAHALAVELPKRDSITKVVPGHRRLWAHSQQGFGGNQLVSQSQPSACPCRGLIATTVRSGKMRSRVSQLPSTIRACLFDLDGVLTRHGRGARGGLEGDVRRLPARAGDARRCGRSCRSIRRATTSEYVDGKPRQDGVRSFLASRGIDAARGVARRSGGRRDVDGLGNRKNELVLAMIRAPRRATRTRARCGTCARLRDAGLRRAVVSASANCREVLEAAGIDRSVRGSGRRGRRRAASTCGESRPRTRSWPPRAMLGVAPDEAAVFEDALAGVAAGRARAVRLRRRRRPRRPGRRAAGSTAPTSSSPTSPSCSSAA